ncbi:MAG: P-loop NTPase fold protein [bacterium]
MEPIKLLTDLAVHESGSDVKDGLGFNTYAEVLGNAALGTKGPFTIGVFGEWGEGKTSLMQMTKDFIDKNAKDQDTVTVWFNAWQYEKEEHPLSPLVATIISALEEWQASKAKFANKAKNLVKALRAIAYGFSVKSTIKVPGFAEIEAGFVAKDMIDEARRKSPDPLLDRAVYYGALSRLEAAQPGDEVKIVVFIDDLDRCFPDLAIKLLESIKLVLNQPGFIFFLGVARSVIEGYLQHRYREEYGIEDFPGDSYLDKIVQLPFYLPPHTERMEGFSKLLLERIAEGLRSEFKELLPIIGAACGSNPRATVRFVNNLLIDRAISNALGGGLEEIPIGVFAVTRSLQQRWRGVFEILVREPSYCKDLSAAVQGSLRDLASDGGSPLAGVVATLIEDNDLSRMLRADHGVQWLTNTELRTATVSFLRSQRSMVTFEDGLAYPTVLLWDENRLNDAEYATVSQAIRESKFGFAPCHWRYFWPAESSLWDELKNMNLKLIVIVVFAGDSRSEVLRGKAEAMADSIDLSATPIAVLLMAGANEHDIPEFLRGRPLCDLRSGVSFKLVFDYIDGVL